MKTILFRLIVIVALAATFSSCGSSKNAADEARKKQELKEKQKELDQNKKNFEMQNNQELK